jgi:hypothetical protein
MTEGIQCAMGFMIERGHFICHWCIQAAEHASHLRFFFVWFEGFRLPHAVASPTKILGGRGLRARHDLDNWRSRMSFSRCLQAQDDGTIQIKAKKVVNIGEVTCIDCSQISPTVKKVWARTWMLVVMLFMLHGAATTTAGRGQVGCACL